MESSPLYDPATGLATPALYEDRLTHALACAQREAAPTALLLIGLDGPVDRLVAMVAQRLRGAVRATDTAARLPGERFGVLLHNVHHDHQAMLVARRIVERLRAPFPVGDRQAVLVPSVGIAFSDVGEREARVPLERAELALTAARRGGGGRCELFTPAAAQVDGVAVDLRADLRHALARGELSLRYQPIVELATARVTGFEALPRWEHPTHGPVAPLELPPLAEETGLSAELGRWLLEQACGQVAGWNAQRPGQVPLTVSVNLSAQQLRQPDLPRTVAGVLARTGLPPSCLTLEITESMLLDDDQTIVRLQQLKAIGAQLAIDDFGIGYSSLAHLRRYPIDMIKIDKMFVDELTSDVGGPTLTRAIVGLGRSLRLASGGAGGAEPAAPPMAQAPAQGHFAKPLTADEANALLAAQPRR